MIIHQAVGMDLPTGFVAGLSQRFQEAFPVRIWKGGELTPPSIAHLTTARALRLPRSGILNYRVCAPSAFLAAVGDAQR